MEVIYKAFDGELFDTEKECLDYEENTYVGYEIFNFEGEQNPNYKAECACFVHFLDIRGYSNFIHACQLRDEDYNGLQEIPEGWFWWDDFNDKYRYLPENIMNAIWKIVNSKKDS